MRMPNLTIISYNIGDTYKIERIMIHHLFDIEPTNHVGAIEGQSVYNHVGATQQNQQTILSLMQVLNYLWQLFS